MWCVAVKEEDKQSYEAHFFRIRIVAQEFAKSLRHPVPGSCLSPIGKSSRIHVFFVGAPPSADNEVLP